MTRTAILLILALSACTAPIAEAPVMEEPLLAAPVKMAPTLDEAAAACPADASALDDGIGGTGCR